jgi:hypothetical protein
MNKNYFEPRERTIEGKGGRALSWTGPYPPVGT